MGFTGSRLLPAILAGASAVGAASLLAPDAFRDMANSSVSVLRTQREYLRDFSIAASPSSTASGKTRASR